MIPPSVVLLLIGAYVYFLFGKVQLTTNCSHLDKVVVGYKRATREDCSRVALT